MDTKHFASLIDVQVGTLHNWEQGRREPTGPAKALARYQQRSEACASGVGWVMMDRVKDGQLTEDLPKNKMQGGL